MLTKKKEKRHKLLISEMKGRAITTDPTDIKRLLKKYYKHTHKCYNLDEMYQFLEKYTLQKYIQEKII